MAYEIPVWHPFVVHFPIALLVLGAFAAGMYGALGRPFWRGAALLAVGAGAAGAVAAYVTGEPLYEMVEGTPIVEEFVGLHETLGAWALGVSLAAFAVLAAAGLRARGREGGRDPLALRLAAAALALAAAVLVVLTGRLGGLMVWGTAG